MVQNTQYHPDLRGAGNREQFTAGDLEDGKAVDSDRYVTVAQVQGNSSTAYGAGIGPKNRNSGEGWSDLDLQLLDDSGAAAAAEGKLRWEVYSDPEKEDLVAYSRTFSAGDLRSAVAADRTDKVLTPAQQPIAGQDSYLVLAFKANDSQDGYTVSAGDSDHDVGMAYSRYK